MNKNEAGKEGAEDVEDIDVEEAEDVEEEEDGDESDKDEKPDNKDEKPVETPEAKAARLLRQTNQARKKLGLEPLGETKPDKKTGKKSDELDYGQKAFLIANGIKDADEMELVKEVMKSTGKSLDDVVGSKYFQAELKEIRDDKATADAIPKGNKKGNNSASNTVDYWIAKGELPPKDQRELRQKVVNARIKAESGKSQFTDTPVAPKY